MYSMVAKRSGRVYVDYGGPFSAFQPAAVEVVKRMPAAEGFKSYDLGSALLFHCLMDPHFDLCFVCIADEPMRGRIPYAFLSTFRDSFLSWYHPEQVDLVAGGMQDEFSPEIQTLLERFNSKDVDRLTSILTKVGEINDLVVDNIEKLLLRQDNIDMLVDRTQLLAADAESYRNRADRLRRLAQCRKVRCYVLSALPCVLIVVAVVFFACGLDFKKCSR